MRRPAFSHAMTLAGGLALGWALSLAAPAPALRAGGGDRSGESIVAAGPILAKAQSKLEVHVARDALYYLDYKGGRLLATIPSLRQSAAGSRVFDDFAERDLVADFRIGPGTAPHFLMTTANLGSSGDGWAPLYVFETTTNQAAAYLIQPQVVGSSTRPRFELLEVRSLARPATNSGPDAP
jgi:hypothetical protein